MSVTAEEHLFVYGTLAPGRPNEHVLADVPGTWRAATVRGVLRELGWGAAQGYPGIVLDTETANDTDATAEDAAADDAETHGLVDGVVFSSPELAEHWDRLDRFEGPEYERVTVDASLEDGTTVSAQIYALRT